MARTQATSTIKAYWAVMDALPIVAYTTDIQGHVIYLSRGWEQATSNNAKQVLSDGFSSLIHPEDQSAACATWHKQRIEGASYRDEYRVRFGDGSYHWMISQAYPMLADDGETIGWCGTLTDIDHQRRAHDTISRDLSSRYRIDRGMHALAETGAVMYGSLDTETALRNIAEAITKTFATSCTIDIVESEGEGEGNVRRIACIHRHPDMLGLFQACNTESFTKPEHPVHQAVYFGVTSFVPETNPEWMSAQTPFITDLVDRLHIHSFITVPVRLPDGSIIGALTCCLQGDDAQPTYANDDLWFLEELGRRTAIALQHARAYERERSISVRFQEASLPNILPTIEHLSLSADYRPGDSEATIGGDWYDAFLLEDGRLVITIGDVLGKGVDAAVTMAKLRQAMRSAAAIVPEPMAMLSAAESAVRDVSGNTYATALAGIYDPQLQVFTFSSAGHPGPTFVDKNMQMTDVTAEGAMLGLRISSVYESVTIDTPPDSALVFFTDGLTEATHDTDEGYRRLHDAIRAEGVLSSDNAARALVHHVLRGTAAKDDTAVLIAKMHSRTQQARQHVSHSWHILAAFSETSIIRPTIRSVLANAGMSENELFLTELATGELVANAVEHGAGDFVDVDLELSPNAITLVVKNEGQDFTMPTVDLAMVGMAESGRGFALLIALGFTISTAYHDGICIITSTLKMGNRELH